MTIIDLAVILFGVFAGYWVVSKLFFGGAKKNGASPTAPPSSLPSPVPRWHDILQVAPTAAEAEIRSAYQRLVSLYHPDKVDNLGQELKDLSVQKMQQITAAYREAMKIRGAER